VLANPGAEIVAVYGRRRVGKTFLIRSVFEKQLVFEFSGVHNAEKLEQLESFSVSLQKAAGSVAKLAIPENWYVAFQELEQYLEPIVKKKKAVVFFDEFPWINTHKSGFLRAFEHFWNSYASMRSNLKVIICGSADAWMIQKVLNNIRGLHNRVTTRMRLTPFTLTETEAYLKSRTVNLDRYQILQLYMVMGGIPQYLKEVRRGESATQTIDRVCFTKHGLLKDEFDMLYASLFDNPSHHVTLIRALATTSKGMTRNEIINATKLSSGGTITNILTELEESGFILSYIPFEKTSKETVYRLSDEYSLFYLKYIEKSRATGTGTWERLREQSTWKSWSGYAFEAVCFKHIPQIKAALGIASIYTEESTWRFIPGKGQPGAQIDLLLDRKDYCINICEMKFSTEGYTITKKYSEELVQKKKVFIDKMKPKKTVFITMITTYGVVPNAYTKGIVQSELTMDALLD
jgi:uncharacterized protein